jgi:type IV pilus assembly protein PilO
MDKSTQQNLIALLIGFIVVVFLYYKFLIVPLDNKYADSIDNLKQAQGRLTDMKRRALELPKLQSEMKQLESEVSDLEKRLPKDKEIPGLLRTITKTGQRFQLRINTITPGAIVNAATYNEVPFQISAQGTYHNIANFFSEIGQDSRILSIKDVNYTALAPTKDNANTVNIIFTLIAYTFKG